MRRHEPMSRHTSWRVGGAALWFYMPQGVQDLCAFMQRVPSDIDIAWCGLGSNILVRDGGFAGVMIATHKSLRNLWITDAHGVYAEAGVPTAKLAKYAARQALCGTEFMIGIPGTVGGALAMNAGCFGAETWEFVRFADTVTRRGEIKRRRADQMSWRYRSVDLGAAEWFTGAEFALQPCQSGVGQTKISQYLYTRAATQPVQTANAGSVFRNPKQDFAARLIEQVGLKGVTVGGARVSPKHANFIENTGQASAADIEALITLMRERVAEVCNIELELEVRIIGEREK